MEVNATDGEMGGSEKKVGPRWQGGAGLGPLAILACVLLTFLANVAGGWQFSVGFVGGRLVWAVALALPVFFVLRLASRVVAGLPRKGALDVFAFIVAAMWLLIAGMAFVVPSLIGRMTGSVNVKAEPAVDASAQVPAQHAVLRYAVAPEKRNELTSGVRDLVLNAADGVLGGTALGRPLMSENAPKGESLLNGVVRQIRYPAPEGLGAFFSEAKVSTSLQTKTVVRISVDGYFDGADEAMEFAHWVSFSLAIGVPQAQCALQWPYMPGQRLVMLCGGQYELVLDERPATQTEPRARVSITLSPAGEAQDRARALVLREKG